MDHAAITGPTAPLTLLRVDGMTCGNCARLVTEAGQAVPEVHSVSVSLTTQNATVRWNSPKNKDVPAVLAAISRAGYQAREIIHTGGGASQTDPRLGQWQLRLGVGLAATLLLMVGEWGFHLMATPWFRWVSLVLGAVVQFWCGAQFYRGASRQLKVGRSNMDTLVALGSTTAFGFSCWVLITGGPTDSLYFMEAVAIISLISLGHWVEARVSSQASSALQALLTLAPATARRWQEPGPPSKTAARDSTSVAATTVADGEIEVPVAELRPGDLIVLKPGDRVPTDGTVTTGESAVDEAMLTGEPLPRDKKTGAELHAGTVNLSGRMIMRVTATGEATALARVIAAVQRAQTSRGNIQRLGDEISRYFVPAVVVIAICAGLWWGFDPADARKFHNRFAPYLWVGHLPLATHATAFIVMAAVLIIACPCAMGLATPAAIMAAANTAARRGFLIRDAIALEKAGRISVVIFDKTGTLTEGKPAVEKFVTFPPSSEMDKSCMNLAVAMARNSRHPISQAIARMATTPEAPSSPVLQEWRELHGAGVQAVIDDSEGATTVRLGSIQWLRECGVEVVAVELMAAEWAETGITSVGLAVDQKLQGLFAIKDHVKAGARPMVAELRRQEFKTYLLTGDNPRTAVSIALQAGIPFEQVIGGSRPEDKALFIKQLQERGERVAYVGDGINDAPALTQADLGIVVSRASDIAREAADIILLRSELAAVPEALGLARATRRIIMQNLFWAFFYNALGIPLAVSGFVSPVWCAVAMGCSDLIVIGNALRLLRWK